MAEVFFYSERADYYDELFKVSPWKRLYLQKTSSLIKKFLPSRNCRILDAGGGTGLLSLPLALMGCEVVIIDSSPQMLAILREKVEALSLQERVSVIKDDISNIVYFGKNEFDFSICSQVLNFLGDNVEKIVDCLGYITKGSVVADVDTKYFWTMMEAMKGFPENALKILSEGKDEVGRAVGGADYRLFDGSEIKSILLEKQMKIELIRPIGYVAGFMHALCESKAFLNESSLPEGPKRYTREKTYEDLLKLEEKFSKDEQYASATQWIQFVYKDSRS